MNTTNKSAFSTALLFFLLLELVHVPLGWYLNKSGYHYSPRDITDYLAMPVLLSLYYLFLVLFVEKVNQEFILAISHIIFWSPWLIWEWVDPSITNCINCERFSWGIGILSGCISAPFFYLNEHIDKWPQWFQIIIVNLLLMALYLYSIARLARYIALKLSVLFLRPPGQNPQ